ncbi:hypothetical protein U1Q18_018814 [Sarracenia purpurea var. burkii]
MSIKLFLRAPNPAPDNPIKPLEPMFSHSSDDGCKRFIRRNGVEGKYKAEQGGDFLKWSLLEPKKKFEREVRADLVTLLSIRFGFIETALPLGGRVHAQHVCCSAKGFALLSIGFCVVPTGGCVLVVIWISRSDQARFGGALLYVVARCRHEQEAQIAPISSRY